MKSVLKWHQVLFFHVLLAGGLVSGCRPGETVDSVSAGLTVPASTAYARGFELYQADGYTLLRVKDPWQGARAVVFDYYLVPRGNDLPEKLEGKQVIRTPVEKVVCFSTTQVAFIDALDMGKCLVGASGTHFICSPALRARAHSGLIREVGYDQGISFETILDLKPDLVLTFGVSGTINQEVTRMQSWGLPVVITAEYLETHPLGKAEWIRCMAAFFGLENTASAIFDSIAASYLALAAIVPDSLPRPAVMLGLPWKDTWYISGSASFAAHLIKDAGGAYLWDDIPGYESVPVNLEAVYQQCRDADVWLNPGAASHAGHIAATDRRLAGIRPVKTGRVYNNNARISEGGGNDYWESGTVKPHLILKDLIHIFHPQLIEHHELYYYKKLD